MYLMELNPLKRVIMACKEKPLVILDPSPWYTVKELLLSTFAIGNGIDRNEVEKAIDELIDLHHPLINEILEIAAYLCAMRKLFIYCANETEWKSLKSNALEAGHFNIVFNLIILSTDLPLSLTLIHELTHAIRYYVLNEKWKPAVNEHREFCKDSFLNFFKSIQQNPRHSLAGENDYLKYLERKPQEFNAISSALCKMNPGIISCEDIKKDLEVLEILRQRISREREIIELKKSMRKNLCDFFELYEEKEQAEEFLPFLLENFVKHAYHEKVPSLLSKVNDIVTGLNLELDGENINALYNAMLFDTLCSALPGEIADDFLNDNFRNALKNYHGSIYPYLFKKGIISLEDNDEYSIPNTISNTKSIKFNKGN